MKLGSRKALALITTALLLSTNPALAASYKAECLTESGEFSSCKVKVGQDRLKVTYKSDHQGSNVDVASEQIVQLLRREYSKEKRRSFLRSALGAAVSSLISDDIREKMGLSSEDTEENHEQVGVTYVDAPLAEELREELLREKTGEDYDEDDTQQVEEEDVDDDTENVKVEAKRKKNLGIPLSKKAIIFDVGNEQDAFALRQELKALTGLEFEAE